MGSLLANSVQVLSTSLKAIAGESTTYRRGNDSIDALVAVPVRTRFDEIGPEEINITTRERDWIVLAEDLVLDGQRLSPKRGDEIDWIDPLGTKRTFLVLPRLGDRCFRHTDPTCQQLRIYSVEALPNSE